jgi:TonB family protein
MRASFLSALLAGCAGFWLLTSANTFQNPVPPSPASKPPVQSPSATPPTRTSLIAQGKELYRKAKYKEALQKFEAALKVEPGNDEALGLAADTAFRLEIQDRARELFLARADLPGQKESVRAFCYYSTALTYWRQAHAIVAAACLVKDAKLDCPVPENQRGDLNTKISGGLKYADQALRINANNAGAHNVVNLLNSEAALAATVQAESDQSKQRAVDALRKAITLVQGSHSTAGMPKANFNFPTVRVGEIPSGDEPFLIPASIPAIKGGNPFTKVAPVFPSVGSRQPTTAPGDTAGTGVTKGGGAYSLGSGRGALTAAYSPGTVKVEVLVSTGGEVVFARIVKGRDDLDGAAIIAARKWKFAPATFEGAPVQVSGVITFEMKPAGSRPKKQPAGE